MKTDTKKTKQSKDKFFEKFEVRNLGAMIIQ